MRTNRRRSVQRWLIAALSVALPMMLASSPANSATCSTSGQVQTSATTLAFGNYRATTSTATTANGTVTVSCLSASTGNLPSFTVALSKGTTATSFSPRQMASGTARLNYNIYRTSAYTTIWGDGTSGTQTASYSSSSNLRTTNFTAFGQIPVGQYVKAAAYTDTITVTVTY